MRRYIVLALAFVLSLLCIVPALALADDDPQPEFTELNQLANKNVGTVLGTTYDSDVLNYVPEGPTFKYYSEMSEMLLALRRGRIAACCLDKPVAQIAMERNIGFAIMPQDAGTDANAIALPKGSPLADEVSSIVVELVENGTMDALEDEWCNSPEEERSLPERDWDTSNGKIICAVDDATEPMSYRNDKGELVGLEVELACLVAKELNMELELVPMSFDAVMTSLGTDNVDMAIAGISITDEREELFELTPAYRSALVTLVTRDTATIPSGFFSRIKSILFSSFVQYGHGTMLLSGLGITLLLVIVSVVLGITLGYALGGAIVLLSDPYDISRPLPKDDHLRLARKVLRRVLLVLEALLLEIPVVLILLLLRYMVFSITTFSGIIVAIAGLSGALAASISNSMRESIVDIGRGPWDVAFSMGYTQRQALLRVIAPLMFKRQATNVHAAVIQTVFDTSVVGLIAVHDITRMADLVRARTTEALPAMFTTAAVYLLLSNLINAIFNKYVRSNNDSTKEVVRL